MDDSHIFTVSLGVTREMSISEPLPDLSESTAASVDTIPDDDEQELETATRPLKRVRRESQQTKKKKKKSRVVATFPLEHGSLFQLGERTNGICKHCIKNTGTVVPMVFAKDHSYRYQPVRVQECLVLKRKHDMLLDPAAAKVKDKTLEPSTVRISLTFRTISTIARRDAKTKEKWTIIHTKKK